MYNYLLSKWPKAWQIVYEPCLSGDILSIKESKRKALSRTNRFSPIVESLFCKDFARDVFHHITQ